MFDFDAIFQALQEYPRVEITWTEGHGYVVVIRDEAGEKLGKASALTSLRAAIARACEIVEEGFSRDEK